jgi:hypothetical protein
MEHQMRALTYICAAGIMAGFAMPALAMDTMMMKKGETMMVMPSGEMATMPAMNAAMATDLMKTAKPMDHCMMMMMGEDGKMYMMDDMKMADGMMACDAMMKMGK